MTISTRGWSLEWLLEKSKRFKPARRVSCTAENLDELIEQHEESDVPLVIEGWHQTSQWPTDLFNMDFCRQDFRNENKKISVRNVHTRSDMSMTFEGFFESSRASSMFAEPEETQRLYGKDVACPQDWEDWLLGEGLIPAQLLPGGCNDLLALRPQKDGRLDVETLMCYFGIGDTYTPCHKDLCASSGQNLMCYTESGSSSFWFMTKGSDCPKVASYFRKMKKELDHEAYVMPLCEMEKAPFDIYIIEQKLGDLVLVPPRSCHQVVNFGKMTIKMSWSRMTLFGLAAALYHELPLYRRVCRPETYQIRSTIYHVLIEYTDKLKTFISKPFDSIQKDGITKCLVQVLRLYDHILIEEHSPYGDVVEVCKSRSKEREKESPGQSSGLADGLQMCDFCGADIFQSYFRCSKSDGPEANSTICSGCYVEGRTCACECMDPKQRQKTSILLSARWEALEALRNTGYSVETFKGSATQKEQRSFFDQKSERSVFQAAMLVHQTRLRNKTRLSRTCRSQPDSHPVPPAWAISCKKCHSSKCFSHLLLLNRMHCIPALFLIDQDSSHVAYHSGHAAKFPEYKTKEKSFLRDRVERPSSAPDFDVQLVHNALELPVCQPINSKHIQIGWYDRLLPAPRAGTKERKPQPRPTASTAPNSDSEVDESDAPSKSYSPTNSSQRSMKNNAYVDIKPRMSIAPPKIIAQEMSISPLTSDPEDSGSEDMPLAYFAKLPKRDLPDESQMLVDLEPGAATSSVNTEVKGAHESKSIGPSGDGTVFAAVHRIGPPRKKRRQESESRSRETQSKESPSRSTKVTSKMRKDKPDDFPASLGDAINQAAESANRMMKGRKHRKGDAEEVKRKQSSGDSTMQQPVVEATTIRKSPSPSIPRKSVPVNDTGLQVMASSSPKGPILVNVADLQDIVAHAAEQVAKKIVEDNSSAISLATKTAVKMMTSYATTGKLVQGNTHMEFPSISHFKEAIAKATDNPTVKAPASIDQRQPKVLTANSGVHSSNNHHQIRETTISTQSSSSTHPIQRKRPSATHPPSRTLPAIQKKRRIIEDDEI